MSYKLVNLKNKKNAEFIQAFYGIPGDTDLLDVRGNDLGHRSTDELVQAFALMPAAVRSLDLRNNGFESRPAAELAVLFQAMPANITSVHLYDETNALADFQKITALTARIDAETGRFASFKNRFLSFFGVLETSDPKVRAFEELKVIIQNGFGKNRRAFHNELRLWKQTHWDCIAQQRNVIHRFFSPAHIPESARAVDDIFAQLGVADKAEVDVPVPVPDTPVPDTPVPDVPVPDIPVPAPHVPSPNIPLPGRLINPYTGPVQPTKPATANKIEKIEKLIKKVNQMVLEEETAAKNKPPKEEGTSKVSPLYIQKLIENMKDVTFSKVNFWNMLNQMGNKDIKLFVNKLTVDKSGKHGSSELDYLWRKFEGLELEPTLMEMKKVKFALILDCLSEEQLEASFESPDFLKILNQDSYAEVLANTLNNKQMASFASDVSRHEFLDKMIIKLKPGPETFSKLIAIESYLSPRLRENFRNQLTHLPYKAGFKIELVELADLYLDINVQIEKKKADMQPVIKTVEKSPSKWKKINVDLTPRYTTQPVDKIDWTEQAFGAFIQGLHAATYITNTDKIIEDLNSMPDDRIKMMIERAALSPFQNLFQHLWVVEATVSNHLSHTRARESRLKIILENMSDTQLKQAITDNKFWEIFGNTQQPYCRMAAEVLTPNQFATIVLNVDLDRHPDCARIINLIIKDSPQEKKRLNDIIEAILPHTSPWLVLTLQLKIRDLLGKDKEHIKRLNDNLKRYLNESMAREDVFLKYLNDTDLNKNAVSSLFSDETKSKINGYWASPKFG